MKKKEFKEFIDRSCPVCDYGKLYKVKTSILCTNPRCGFNIKTGKNLDIDAEIAKAGNRKSLEEQADDFLSSHGFSDLTKLK